MVCRNHYLKNLVTDFWLQCLENQPNQPNPNKMKNELETKIIELLKACPELTTKEIMRILEITDNQVKYYIKKLKDDGKIERIGTNRKGSWKVI